MINNFDDFLEEKRIPLYRFCLYYLGEKADAEDAVQLVLTKALENRQAVLNSDNQNAYLFTIAKNVCRDHLKLSRRIDRLVGINLDLILCWHPETPATFLNKLILLLPEQQKLVFILRNLQDLSTEETARILGISEGTVKSQLSRAVGFLKARINRKKI